MHDGHAVVAHYGSAAGELAACVSAVGLADELSYRLPLTQELMADVLGL